VWSNRTIEVVSKSKNLVTWSNAKKKSEIFEFLVNCDGGVFDAKFQLIFSLINVAETGKMVQHF
jgi:hypothetical protein